MTEHRTTPFDIVSDMEPDIRALRAYGNLLAMVADDAGDEYAALALNALADDIRRTANSLNERYSQAFHALHRQHYGAEVPLPEPDA
jgi:hypothetical protein